MVNKLQTRRGSIYTPADFAKFLSDWAIRSHTHRILDIGVGEGAFTFAAYERLRNLGADEISAQKQIYGCEISRRTYANFTKIASGKDLAFRNVQAADFFDLEFPRVDALIGNPPYVRRTHLTTRSVTRVRTVIANGSKSSSLTLSRLTDLYIYFLLHGMRFLKPGGRLAVITADSWLNTRYGRPFKKLLCERFVIEQLISLDRRVFDAGVKPVLLLASKRTDRRVRTPIQFVRLKNGLPINQLSTFLAAGEPDTRAKDLIVTKVPRGQIDPDVSWGRYFKAPQIYDEIARHPLIVPLNEIGRTRIGLQTLAKDFFVLSAADVDELQLENRYLQPLAHSSRYFGKPIIRKHSKADVYLFYCAQPKAKLVGTKALSYIRKGESTSVVVRGKRRVVLGYQNKERIQQDKRNRWYDLKTSLDRRGRASILIPRLIYRRFTVLWNKADYVPGELFIEFLPVNAEPVATEVYLAILSSSQTELMLRSRAHVYGEGTYNINPGQIRHVPILNPIQLNHDQRHALKAAYRQYLRDPKTNRRIIDNVINEIMGFTVAKQKAIGKALRDLLIIATAHRKRKAL